ncbi:MAG TPA: 1-(5-phosphoribosyl)-5-[(5-phosphoribosylamino)methylideneamino] imidazole-4-carboxamide isomerase [Gemmatimonadaceae bacterium]|jgi:phosphoribosylformimino-5-aminoimidazole carboxamide ribotide isomerase|nr:1-(5-phosphoribosyl)-5-[(5-phosphoribosylamino)methylideneamino] imidazole-4-carboxamide isomerase [Gemmatimonadaceae bacterium]
MLALPAIDIRDGACVQLVGGSFDDERVRIADPLDALRRWARAGFRRIHVVDLDAALGTGTNRDRIDALLASDGSKLQVGGGVRTTEIAGELLTIGAAHVVVGTRALEEPAWLEEIATRHPNQIIVAVDVRGRDVVTHGWTSRLPLSIGHVIDRLRSLPLGGVLVTAVHVEGRLSGPDLPLVSTIVRRATVPVIASGGIATMDDLRCLAATGAAGAVIGMALYTGALDACAVAEEFCE